MSEVQLVQVRKAAELTTAAEAVRARVLAGDAGWTLSCSSRSRAKTFVDIGRGVRRRAKKFFVDEFREIRP